MATLPNRVAGVFTPLSGQSLKNAVVSCLAETLDGSCPTFAASDVSWGNPYGAMGDWVTSKVTGMSYVFDNYNNQLGAFNVEISKWDTSKVTTMSNMFFGATVFNSDISKWDTSKVTDMSSLLYEAESFNGDISKWDTSQVTDMSTMFTSTKVFNRDISKWDTSQVTDMSSLFNSATAFNNGGQPLTLDTSKVTNMRAMFASATAFNQVITMDTSLVLTRRLYGGMLAMFWNTTSFNNGGQPLNLIIPANTAWEMFNGSAFNPTDNNGGAPIDMSYNPTLLDDADALVMDIFMRNGCFDMLKNGFGGYECMSAKIHQGLLQVQAAPCSLSDGLSGCDAKQLEEIKQFYKLNPNSSCKK